jgi:ABC-type nickel/cobalt efflux system permease component RcnA
MSGGTIFVLFLAAGFAIFIAYLAVIGRRSRQHSDNDNGPGRSKK